MPIVRVSGSQLSTPSHVRFTSQGVYIEGMQKTAAAIARRLQTIIDSMPKVIGESTREALQPIYDLSQQYVPEDTGKLKLSGFIEVQQKGTRVAIGYGRGGRPWYAAYVHEATWMRHAKGKYAKFLERAVNERIHVFKALLGQSLQKNVGSRGRVR